jgi:chaperonin cofactor prefoldin
VGGFFAGCFSAGLFTGCNQRPDELQTQVRVLKQERETLADEVAYLKTAERELQDHVDYMHEHLRELAAKDQGKKMYYVMRLKLHQSHFSLDIGKHIKDAMNAVEFSVPVDEEVYRAHEVGNQFLKSFRAGSFWMEGSVGNWKITVVDKHIEFPQD